MKQINILFILLAFFSCNAYCQSVSATSYAMLAAQPASRLQEKIFIQTDKTFYVAGEIIWFKIYCVDASSHKPLDLSKVAYIELLDSTHKPAAQAKISLIKGNGNGSFQLPFTVSSGSYRLRAYTSWMKNEEADQFFEKNITIINIQKLTVDVNKQRAEAALVSFFPEGGSLVENIKSRVAFKVVNQQGKGIHCTGIVKDGNDSILSFSDHQSGIGSFHFTPVKNHVYTAQIQAENGSVVTQSLPVAEALGFTMNIGEINNNILSVNVETNGIESQPVYLIIHKNKKTIVAKEGNLKGNKVSFPIDTSLLPCGVITITIFNAEKQPVCERLFYKKYPSNLSLNVSVEKENYDIRNRVNISIATIEKSIENNDSASISMSVYRIDSLQKSEKNTIDHYLNFTSELPGLGGGEQDDFSEPDDLTTDDVMLVNGWRKLNVDMASNASLLSFAPEYRGHIISGNITNNITHLPENNINVYLSIPGKGKQLYTAVSDSLGNVKWETENWYGSAKLVAQTERKDTSYTINISDPFSHQYSAVPIVDFALPSGNQNTLLQHSIGMQTGNIYLGNEMNKFAVSFTDSTPFFISADKSYRLDDYARFTTMEEVLREYIALVNVTRKKSDFHLPVYDLSGERMFDDDPLVLVDGVPFFNLDSFMAIDPMKLRKMDVVNRRYFYGNTFFDGILNWQTYTGDATTIDIDPNAVTIDYEGLQEKRIFYSPAYETEEQLNSHLPDFRNTLYWNPDIILKGSKAKPLSFFTSDVPGKYAVVVEGAGSAGLYSSMTTFVVIKK